MAVAAYASLVSLTNVLDNVQNRVQLHLLNLDQEYIKALQDNVCFLLDYVEVRSQIEIPEIQGLWGQVIEVASEAEDVLDLHIVDQLHQRSGGDTIIVGKSSFCQDMDRVVQRMVCIKKVLLDKEEVVDVRIEKQPRLSVQVGSSEYSFSPKNIMVGFDKDVVRIMDELTNNEDDLRITSIVGMGGIGKTTVARHVFNHPTIVDYFYKRLWSTISQQYAIREIILHLLYNDKNKESSEDIAKLGEKLHKKLFGRRYLIVLDDVWSVAAWYDIKIFIPNNRNGSRVMITTRLSNVASSISSQKPYLINFLNEDESWNLFRLNIFGGEGSPNSEFEKIGRKIAKGCRGLPLAIIIISRLLAKSNMTRQYWEFVAKNVTLLGNLGDDELNCLNMLTLSYNNLPIHLKPCFLHMRIFPEDSEIDVSKLVKLWVAEGYIKLGSDRSLEEIAEEYLNDLIDRNLLFVRGWKNDEEIKMCGIHDLLRDLCLRESHKESFALSSKVQCLVDRRREHCYLCGERPIMGANVGLHLPKLVLTLRARSKVCMYMFRTGAMDHSKLRLARVISRKTTHLDDELVLPSNMCHVSIENPSHVKLFSLSELHLFWNLQFLLISTRVDLPCAIWEMSQLRHIQASYTSTLPEPTNASIAGKHLVILKNLQALGDIRKFPCTKEIIDRIPNLKRLKISEASFSDSSFLNLATLHKLERLHVMYPSTSIAFPNSLKRLSLMCCKLQWNDMSIVIGWLPNLEVLKLRNATEGPDWSPKEGEFAKLKRLHIEECDVVQWRADEIHFPKLECLELYFMHSLDEIPLAIGDIVTLRSIHMVDCSKSAINSAKLIWEEQQSMGNESLQIYVDHKPMLQRIESLRFENDDSNS